MVIHANSQQELAQLAELLLSRFNDFKAAQALCADCGSVTNITPTGVILDETDLYSRIYIAKVEFTVGDANMPQNGATKFKFTKTNGSIFTEIEIDVFREGILQDSPDQFTFDEALNEVTVVTPLIVNAAGKGERIVVKIYKKAMLVAASVVPSGVIPSAGFPYTFPYPLS